MKLKYLLPVATVASVASIVTPLVTSCSKKDKYDYEYNLAVDNFEPKTKQLESWSSTYTTKDYLNAIKKDNQIFSDDLAYSLYQQYDKTKMESYTAKVKLNDVNVDKELASCKVYFEQTMKAQVGKHEAFTEKYEMTFTNMHVSVLPYEWGPGYECYSVLPKAWYMSEEEKKPDSEVIKLLKDDNASISGKFETISSSATDVEEFNYDTKHLNEYNVHAWIQMYSKAKLISWYLLLINN